MASSLLDFYDTPEFEVMGVGNMDGSFSLAEILDMEMESLGWSQKRLASTSGLSTTTIHDLLKGTRGLTGRSVACLSVSLGLSPDVLIAADSASRISDVCEDILVSDHFVSQKDSLKHFVEAKSLIPHRDMNWFTKGLIRRNLWRSCPRIVEDYRSIFYGALSVMRSSYRGEYFWARLESFGIERDYVLETTLNTCDTIPIRLAQVFGEVGIGTIYTWLVVSLKSTTFSYMGDHVHELTEMARTIKRDV